MSDPTQLNRIHPAKAPLDRSFKHLPNPCPPDDARQIWMTSPWRPARTARRRTPTRSRTFTGRGPILRSPWDPGTERGRRSGQTCSCLPLPTAHWIMSRLDSTVGLPSRRALAPSTESRRARGCRCWEASQPACRLALLACSPNRRAPTARRSCRLPRARPHPLPGEFLIVARPRQMTAPRSASFPAPSVETL